MSNQILQRFREYIQPTQFNAVRLRLSSPDKIRSLSYGEVKKIETINYRTLKPEKDGLFCAKIFGPQKDWECNCGKYKRMKHRGVTCEKCGVEVIQARVRRERMGHVELVAPVCHIWYLKGTPSYLSLILDLSVKELERVIYFDSYMVIHQGDSPWGRKSVISNAEFNEYKDNHPDDIEFVALSGAEAIKQVLELVDLDAEVAVLQEVYKNTSSVAVRHKIMRRIKILTGLAQAQLRPEWMILDVLPVLPPDLRPLVPLEGGRFASSDLNELYRRVLNRNIRLQRLMEIEAPEVIIKNEKRMLQESVDSLIDNGRRGQPVRGGNKRPLKSLSEMLRGKQGRFRQNLLGKRVDYSGRSVIVVDPTLKMNQCGLPKKMALELFKAHVFAELLKRELATNLRIAKRMVEEGVDVVWDVLDYVVQGRAVLLNRAPTLHRLGIQGFYPILVDGKAIKIHPLVCAGFNADFDGDQMAVHLPLSEKAQIEAKNLILATNSLLSPSNGKPLGIPSQEMVIGLHYLSKVRRNLKGQGTVFSSIEEVVLAHQCQEVALHAIIKLRLDNGTIVETTVGRAILFSKLPKGSDIAWVNKLLRKRDIAQLIEAVFDNFGAEKLIECLDVIKSIGFSFATAAGISFPITDLVEPESRSSLIKNAENQVKKIDQMYVDGAITNGERYNKIISLWYGTTAAVADAMYQNFEETDHLAYLNEDKQSKPFNPIYMSIDSGARGSRDQIKQLVGMRGLMSKPSGEVMETPVKSNFKSGLSVFEYFISTHGARKGQADTALKTANSGYLTRRLVDVAQDVVVTMQDCGTLGFINLENLKVSGKILHVLLKRIYGRHLAADLKDSLTGKVLLPRGTLVQTGHLEQLKDAYFTSAQVRSVLSCQAKRGVCAQCYGMDLSTRQLVQVGVAVGIIAAQSIGEPGTQLTMRTFHIGGTANVAEQTSYTADHEGTIEYRDIHTVKNRQGRLVVVSRDGRLVIIGNDGRELRDVEVGYGAELLVENNQQVKADTKLLEIDQFNDVIICEKSGMIQYIDLINNVTMQEKHDETTKLSTKYILENKSDKYQPAVMILDKAGQEIAQYYIPHSSYLLVEDGYNVQEGDILVKIPKEASKTKDITGGLPRISEIFEARISKDSAIISDIDGEVVFNGLHRGYRKISVVAGEESFDYLIPRDKQLIVANGDRVKSGDALTTGLPILHDLLRILGPDVLQTYIVNQVQEIYRLQGVDIDDRHIELIGKQMLRKVRVIDPGDTDFLIGDRVDKIHFRNVNALLRAEGKRAAVAKPILMGLTMASVGTESFFSAASFQETTRILAEAAVFGQVDHLYGLKENIIIGKLIPAGTGVATFRKRYLENNKSIYQAAQESQSTKEFTL
ncbi:MAG: DNA-directed RNA polymerase subunit beta' [Candidatus Chromulinivorax sp.]